MSMSLMVDVMKLRVGNPLRKLVLLKLADNANDSGESWPSFRHLADQCEISRRSVIVHIDALCAVGLLRKESRTGPKGNSSNVYYLTLHGAGDSPGGSANNSPPDAADSPGGSAGAAPRISHSFESVNEPVIEPENPCTVAPYDQDDPAQIVRLHLNAVTKSTYRDSKATMGYIRGRLSDIYSAEDLILVTDYATAKWLGDPKMCDYLRPKTLFGPENFQEYYQKAIKWHGAGRPECVNGKWVTASYRMVSPVQNTIPYGFRGNK